MLHVIVKCPCCDHTNQVEVEGMPMEPFSCEKCGTELVLLRVDQHWHVVRN